MANHDLRILKFLSENPALGPSIMELMKRLNIPISEIGPTLDSLFNRHMVTMQIDHNGVERWYPASSTEGSFTSPENEATMLMTPMPVEPRSEPASASMPTTSFAELTTGSNGVSWPMFLLCLLIMGAGAAWVGGRYLSRETVKAAMGDKVDQKSFSAALTERKDYETMAGIRFTALEAKSKDLVAALDSLKATQLRLKKLTVAVDSLKAEQVKASKSKKGRKR